MPYNYGTYNPQYNQQNQMMPTQYAMPQQQQMPQQMSYASQPMNQQSNGFVWVRGEVGAIAYPDPPAGRSVLLMDSDNPVLYMKSTDISGRPLPIETYDLVKRENVVASYQANQTPQLDMSEYVKKSDIEEMITKAVNKALEQ